MKNMMIVLAAVCSCLAVLAADAPVSANDPAPKQNFRRPLRRGGDGIFWRVFSRMSREERRSMMELQARDPAAFQAAMKQKAEALRAEDAAMRKKMDALVQRCRTGNEQEKAAAKAELEKIFRKGFEKRLADSRRHLQEMQRRLQKFEADLKRMETNADKEISRAVEDYIQGRLPAPPEHRDPSERPRRGYRPDFPPPPPPPPER